MSRLYNDATKHAYLVAHVLLQRNLDSGVIEQIISEEHPAKTEQEQSEIIEAMERIVASLKKKASS